MILTIKHRFNIYKRYESDIWTTAFSRLRDDIKVVRFFFNLNQKKIRTRFNRRKRYIYRIDIINPRVRKKRIIKRLFEIRLVKLFYLTFTYKQFRALAKRAVKRDVTLKQIIVCF